MTCTGGRAMTKVLGKDSAESGSVPSATSQPSSQPSPSVSGLKGFVPSCNCGDRAVLIQIGAGEEVGGQQLRAVQVAGQQNEVPDIHLGIVVQVAEVIGQHQRADAVGRHGRDGQCGRGNNGGEQEQFEN